MEGKWFLVPKCECYLVDEISTSPPKVNHVCSEKSCEVEDTNVPFFFQQPVGDRTIGSKD